MLSLHQWYWYLFAGDLNSFISKNSLSSGHKKTLQKQQQYFALIQRFTFWKLTLTRLLLDLCECFKEFFKIFVAFSWFGFVVGLKWESLSLSEKRPTFSQQRDIQGRRRDLWFLCSDANVLMFLVNGQLVVKVLLWVIITFRYHLLAKY